IHHHRICSRDGVFHPGQGGNRPGVFRGPVHDGSIHFILAFMGEHRAPLPALNKGLSSIIFTDAITASKAGPPCSRTAKPASKASSSLTLYSASVLASIFPRFMVPAPPWIARAMDLVVFEFLWDSLFSRWSEGLQAINIKIAIKKIKGVLCIILKYY